MIKNGYEEKIVVKYSEIDQNLAMKPFALLNFLQDIASKNAEELGFGYSFIQPRNYAWFLIKYRMEFVEYPIDIQELTLMTEPRGYNKLFAFRDFELYNGEKLMGRMHSMWSLVDIETRSIVPVSTAILENPKMMPYIPKMKEVISNVLNLNPTEVSIKAKTKEKLDAVGESLAIEANSVVLLKKS